MMVMTGTVQSRYTTEEVAVWLHGLFTIAWADGHFDEEEKVLIADLTHQDLPSDVSIAPFTSITPTELSATLGKDRGTAENFLRMAVMVAIADGIYTPSEDTILQQFCDALGHRPAVLDTLHTALGPATITDAATAITSATPAYIGAEDGKPAANVLTPVQEWLDHLEIHDARLAHFLCRAIPPQCPFERDVVVFGRKIAHIPPMCKLNPLYEQLVGLRFRALSYLADECGEDVSAYC